jgi:hypothetical protein
MTADDKLRADLQAVGLIVTHIERTDARLVVACRTARQTPLVAVVDRGPAELDIAFARLMTKSTIR